MKDELGTTDITSKLSRKKSGKPDFKKELKRIKKELKALGLRK